MKKVLVISVHPDDETLGAGGSLLRHSSEGDEIHWLIITCINKRLNGALDVETRNEEISKVSKVYNYKSINQFYIDSQELEIVPRNELIRKISNTFIKIKPEILYLPFYGDAHSEHKYVFESSYACTKSFRFPFIREVYMMEVISETNFGLPVGSQMFCPNYFVDITDFLETKKEIMSIYKSELQAHPFPRSLKAIDSLALLRGTQAGVVAAEAFTCLKFIR